MLRFFLIFRHLCFILLDNCFAGSSYERTTGRLKVANKKHIQILDQGLKAWNEWRDNHPYIIPDLSKTKISGYAVSNLNFQGANLGQVDFTGANLAEANLEKANLKQADLSAVDLQGARMAFANLVRADLQDANFVSTILDYAHLNQADLSGADLTGAKLHKAELKLAKLDGANLSGANLIRSELQGASLIRACLKKALLSAADLSNANFTEADLRRANLLNVIVDNVTWESANTVGMVSTDLELMQMFKEQETPERLLKHLLKPLYHSCFISYSHGDKRFACKLADDLGEMGVDCWLDRDRMEDGDEISERLRREIDAHDRVVAVLSHHSIKSAWVKQEMHHAFTKEQNGGERVVVPVQLDHLLDFSKGDDWSQWIRHYRKIGDFTQWQIEEKYDFSLERLTRAISKGSSGEETPSSVEASSYSVTIDG